MLRPRENYLKSTLKSLVENLSGKEAGDTLIIVFVAEENAENVAKVAGTIQSGFGNETLSGLIEVIGPPPDFYPDFDALKPTLGDSADRMCWRTKQNLDYVLLMSYARGRGKYYVQLQDDVHTKPGYVSAMKEFADSKGDSFFLVNFSWSTLSGRFGFCRGSDKWHLSTRCQTSARSIPAS